MRIKHHVVVLFKVTQSFIVSKAKATINFIMTIFSQHQHSVLVYLDRDFKWIVHFFLHSPCYGNLWSLLRPKKRLLLASRAIIPSKKFSCSEDVSLWNSQGGWVCVDMWKYCHRESWKICRCNCCIIWEWICLSLLFGNHKYSSPNMQQLQLQVFFTRTEIIFFSYTLPIFCNNCNFFPNVDVSEK